MNKYHQTGLKNQASGNMTHGAFSYVVDQNSVKHFQLRQPLKITQQTKPKLLPESVKSTTSDDAISCACAHVKY